jgi:hypothetical protein
MVRYVIESGGGETRVETKVTWREQSGEMVPATITRLENGRVAAKLTVRSVSFAAQSNDGLFDGPKAGRP